MQRLANTLNHLTSCIGHRIAFEAVDTSVSDSALSGLIESWRDEGALNVILGGKLKVILN